MTDLQMRIGHRRSPSDHQVEPRYSHKQWNRPGYNSTNPSPRKRRPRPKTSRSSPMDVDAEPSLLLRMNLSTSSPPGKSRSQEHQTKTLAERISRNVANTTPLGRHVIESSGDYEDTSPLSSDDAEGKELEVTGTEVWNKRRLEQDKILSLSTSSAQELKQNLTQEQSQTESDSRSRNGMDCEESHSSHGSIYGNTTAPNPLLRSEDEIIETQTPFKSQLATLIIQNSQLRQKHEELDRSKPTEYGESIDLKAIDAVLTPDICASINFLALLAGKQYADVKESETGSDASVTIPVVQRKDTIIRNNLPTLSHADIMSTSPTDTYKQPLASSSRQTLPDIANNLIRATTENKSLVNTSETPADASRHCKAAPLSAHSPSFVCLPSLIPIPIPTMSKPRDVSPPLTVSPNESYSSHSSLRHDRRPSRDYDHDRDRLRDHGRRSSEDYARDLGRRSSYQYERSRSPVATYSQRYYHGRRSSTEYRHSYYPPRVDRRSRSPEPRRVWSERRRSPSPGRSERNDYRRSRSPPQRQRTPPLVSPATSSRSLHEHHSGVEENRTSFRRTPTSPKGYRSPHQSYKGPYSPTDDRGRSHQQVQRPARGDVNNSTKHKIELDTSPRPRTRTSGNSSIPTMVHGPSPVNAETHHDEQEGKPVEMAARAATDSNHPQPPCTALSTIEGMQVSTVASTIVVPDVWCITAGSKSSTTHEHVFEVDKEKAIRWRIPFLEKTSISAGQSWEQAKYKRKMIKPEISLRLACYPRDQFHAVHMHKSLGDTPRDMIEQLKKLQCKWPPIGKLLIQVNPDNMSGKTLHPNELVTKIILCAGDASQTFLKRDLTSSLELNMFIREGQNLVRLIQLGNISEYSFILYSVPSTQAKRPISDINISHGSQTLGEIRDLVASSNQNEELSESIVAKFTILDADEVMERTVG